MYLFKIINLLHSIVVATTKPISKNILELLVGCVKTIYVVQRVNIFDKLSKIITKCICIVYCFGILNYSPAI